MFMAKLKDQKVLVVILFNVLIFAHSDADAIDRYNKKAKYYENEIDALDKAISLGLEREDEADTWHRKGISLSNLNRDDEAVKAFDKAISLGLKQEDEAIAWYQKGLILSVLDRYDEAVKALDKAISLGLDRKDEADAWYRKGYIFYDKKDYKKAMKSINKTVELGPEYAQYRGIQANIYLQQGDIQNAGRSYEKALELTLKEMGKEPSVGNYVNASWYALFIPRFSDAEGYAKKGLELDPDQHALRTNLAHAYLFQGKKTEAIAEYRKFIDNYKDNPRDVLKDDFSLLKKRYPDKSALIEWAEGELGMRK